MSETLKQPDSLLKYIALGSVAAIGVGFLALKPEWMEDLRR